MLLFVLELLVVLLLIFVGILMFLILLILLLFKFDDELEFDYISTIGSNLTFFSLLLTLLISDSLLNVVLLFGLLNANSMSWS